MNIIQNIVSKWMGNHPNSQGMVIDFSKMPIEDAVTLLMLLLTSDAKRDMKDMLDEMETTRRKKKVLKDAKSTIGQSTATQQGAGDLKISGQNPMFDDAVSAIKKDIAGNEKIKEKEKTAAIADEAKAAGILVAAKQTEQDAGGLEQPVNPDRPKKSLVIPLVLSILFILVLIGAALIKLGLISLPVIPAAGSTLQTVTSNVGVEVTNTVIFPTVTRLQTLSDTPLPALTGTAKLNDNCRTGPGTVYPVLSTITKGTMVNVTGISTDGLWLKVQPCGQDSGWVLVSLMDVTGSLSVLPILVSPPTPIVIPPTDTSAPFNCKATYGGNSGPCGADPRCYFNITLKTWVNK